MTPRPFRFGVIAESVRDRCGLLDTACRAEAAGYDTLLIRDHFVTEPFGDQLAPVVALAALAESTTTLRLGTLVLANDYRHPVLLAKEAATLQHLSGGRFELGIGAGWLREEYERAGMGFDRAGVRVDRLAESLEVLRGLLGGESLRYHGTHYTVDGLRTFPAAEPVPPILVGAGAERMLRLAGRTADIVGILPRALPRGDISAELSERTPEAMDRKIGWVREGAGARFDQVELSQILSVHAVADHRAAAESIAAERGWSVQDVLDMPSRVIGTPERMAEELLARRERYGLTYHVVSDRDMDAVAPVVRRLA
jgi:probable F420-dependent oxidoreductase